LGRLKNFKEPPGPRQFWGGYLVFSFFQNTFENHSYI
jgi:hypothetical protein